MRIIGDVECRMSNVGLSVRVKTNPQIDTNPSFDGELSTNEMKLSLMNT